VKFQVGSFLIDEDTRQLLRGDREVHLSPKAFDLLATLIRARPRALSKADLHACLWPESFVSDASLAMLVAEVRSALSDSARAPRFVRTVHRHGYAFHGIAMELEGPGRPAAGASAVYWILAPLREIPLAAGENVVGRDPRAQVCLDSPSVSRRHARIMVEGDRVTLEDLKSKNGTQVHGRLITDPVPLADGDEIRFGSVGVTFRVSAADGSTRSEAGRDLAN
jgi:DNA-binding winged helix-turn-helix (wHTH) protein